MLIWLNLKFKNSRSESEYCSCSMGLSKMSHQRNNIFFFLESKTKTTARKRTSWRNLKFRKIFSKIFKWRWYKFVEWKKEQKTRIFNRKHNCWCNTTIKSSVGWIQRKIRKEPKCSFWNISAPVTAPYTTIGYWEQCHRRRSDRQPVGCSFKEDQRRIPPSAGSNP